MKINSTYETLIQWLYIIVNACIDTHINGENSQNTFRYLEKASKKFRITHKE